MPAPDPRHKPAEDAVREQLRAEEERISPEAPADAPSDSEAEPGADDEADAEPEATESGTEAPDAEDEAAESGTETPDAEDEAAEPGTETPDAESEPETPDAEPEEPAAALQRERDEYLALAQRTQADFENWRKRAARESAAAGRRAKSGLVGELLPVLDNLERALASAGEGDGLAGGVRLVHSELISVLARNGVEPFDPKGQAFDPSEHEALSTRPDEQSGSGVVLDVVEKGYRLGDAVLRPARVVVSG